jgi:hypothetical protein
MSSQSSSAVEGDAAKPAHRRLCCKRSATARCICSNVALRARDRAIKSTSHPPQVQGRYWRTASLISLFMRLRVTALPILRLTENANRLSCCWPGSLLSASLLLRHDCPVRLISWIRLLSLRRYCLLSIDLYATAYRDLLGSIALRLR